MNDLTDEGFDIIGDVHGCALELVQLLELMGYSERDGAFRHPTRQAVFVGDLIDRGHGQIASVNIARSMVKAGTALAVAGNHEFNAIAWATAAEDRPTGWLRNRTTKAHQHQAFVSAVRNESELHGWIIEWFRGLPLWLDLGGLRVVHACWDPAQIEWLESGWGQTPLTDPDFMRRATDSENEPREYWAIEHLLKGPEIAIEPPYLDKGGTPRDRARAGWWNLAEPTTDAGSADTSVLIRQLVHIPEGTVDGNGEEYQLAEPDRLVPSPIGAYDASVPVIFGHYWFSGEEPAAANARAACVDWSCAKGGMLASYRWSGESDLDDRNWVSVPSHRAGQS